MLRVVVHEFTSRFTIRIGRARYGRLAHTTRPEDRQPRVGHASEGHFAASRISIRHLDPWRACERLRGGLPLLASCRPLVLRGKGRSGVRDAAPVPRPRTPTTEKRPGRIGRTPPGKRGSARRPPRLEARPFNLALPGFHRRKPTRTALAWAGGCVNRDMLSVHMDPLSGGGTTNAISAVWNQPGASCGWGLTALLHGIGNGP